MNLNAVDKVEILTLQDNYIDITAMDNSSVITRAAPIEGMEIKKSILAEHGFSALVTVTEGEKRRSVLFDFGFSEDGAARNAALLTADLGSVEALALSHGHSDHTGALARFADMLPRDKGKIPFVAHPGVFGESRYLKLAEEFKIHFPKFSRDTVNNLGFDLVETAEPYPLLGGTCLFLGQIPRETAYEKGFPIAHHVVDGTESWDPIEDDTALAINVRGKGLVVLTGCAHAGIVNTVRHAMSITGISQLYAVMGGFHLSGPFFEPIIEQTTNDLKEMGPTYVIPTHCTGRKAIMHMEQVMPEQFILNMSGTTLTFAA